MTDLQLTIELGVLGSHLYGDEWHSYLLVIETLKASGLPHEVILKTAEAYIKTRDEHSMLS